MVKLMPAEAGQFDAFHKVSLVENKQHDGRNDHHHRRCHQLRVIRSVQSYKVGKSYRQGAKPSDTIEINGHIKLPQKPINVNVVSVAIAGFDRGRITL